MLRSFVDGMTRSFAERRLPADLARPIATTGDGRDITRPWVQEIEESRDPHLAGAVDWGVYERIRQDDQVKSCMQQRISAVVSREWTVLPGDENDARSVEAAAKLTDQLTRIGWDQRTEKMLWASFYGYQVAELLWKGADGLLGWDKVKVRHARRFRFDSQDRLRLLTRANPTGEILPERKFWVVRAGGTDDDTPYGEGLAQALYWPTLFKRNGVAFWNTFLDKFAVPTAKGTYPRGTSQEDIKKFLQALKAIASDTGFVVPEGMAVELLQLAQQGADFEKLCRYMDGAISKIILSQTMTTDNGSSRAQGEVHEDVKLEVVKADADLLSDSFNTGPARWWTDLNYGPDVASPIVMRIVEEEDDLKGAAGTDAILFRLGWRRTEESFNDRYGEGYERVEPAKPGKIGHNGGPALDTEGDQREAAFAAADPKPLYVYRRVRNADDIIAWARSQGFASTVSAADLHVTIAYSRQPVNWFEMAEEFARGNDLIVPEGGPRIVDALGDQGAVVLHFSNSELTFRNRSMREKGASWDFADYHPHVTLTYAGGGLDLASIKPYRGRIVLGPEIFEALDEDWADRTREVSFAEVPAVPRDIVDEAVDQLMADEGWREAFAPVVDPLLEQLRKATSRDDVPSILSRAAALGDTAALTETLARAGFALRIDALTDDQEEG